MEPVESNRKNASQHKECRKRVVTKNELKGLILTYYTSQFPCVTETCKVEKRELNSLIKAFRKKFVPDLNLNRDLLLFSKMFYKLKDASIKVLRENLSTMRLTIREFSCFIASNYPGTAIAAKAQAWEKRWKAEDEEGLWNIASSSKILSTVHRHSSQTKPSTSSTANTSTASDIQSEKAQFVSPQQNNIFHEYARNNAIAISRRTNSNVLHKSPGNLEQFISPSLITATNTDKAQHHKIKQ
ncbi:hypothetical protein DINM_000089 [Dirofilaria immitis]|nr:hypothetical protein [Dirofilaria immitis]